MLHLAIKKGKNRGKMHKKKRFTYILYGICFVLLCTGIAGSIAEKNGKNFKEIKTALLNPKYTTEVNCIRIILHKSGQNELILRKNEKNAMWTGIFEGKNNKKIHFPADNRQVDSLIETARKVRSMYIISDSNAQKGTKSPFFAPNDEFFGFEFLRDERLFSHFYAQKSKNADRRLYIKSAAAPSVSGADGDLSAFLSIYPATWADGKLFSEYALGGKTTDEVQKIVYILYDKTGGISAQKSFAAGDADFYRRLSDILAARTLRIGAKPDSIFFNGLEKSYEIRLEFADGEKRRIVIYPAGDDFIVVPDSLDYALHISTWTASSIGIPFFE